MVPAALRTRRAPLLRAALAASVCTLTLAACTPQEEGKTPLPTRQTTIDPVKGKLDAAQQDAEKRRAEVDAAGK